MRLNWIVTSASVVAALLATQAVAFEKQELGASVARQQPPGIDKPDTTLTEKDATAGRDSAAKGTAITIPGLGTVGVIPKMDFGMELLYGSDNKPPADVAPEEQQDGLQIRGTIKHRF